MEKKTKKRIYIVILVFIILYLVFDARNIYTDIYNFKQLEKAKPILESINVEEKYFWLDTFNSKYKADIQPLKNCYYVSSENWAYSYIYFDLN